jgi:hydroxymethylpyrimidine/phosphomethylpyrimidine kinase
MTVPARVLIIAGSDSGGGAGIQADIKTVSALGGYAATAITALTAQNTQGVHAVEAVSPDFVAKQIEVVLEDIGADAMKIGMLHNADVISHVADALDPYDIPLVLDPVMVAKGGQSLLEQEAIAMLKARLFSKAMLLTPNIPEAEVLTGKKIQTLKDMEQAGHKLMDMGVQAVLIKGGHLEGNTLTDVLVTKESVKHFATTKIETKHTHGTGCTMASAIAVSIAQGMILKEAVARAQTCVHKAIEEAPGFGKGHGPLWHNV